MKSGAAARARNTPTACAVFTHANGGLMVEAAIGGQKFTFVPAANSSAMSGQPPAVQASAQTPAPPPHYEATSGTSTGGAAAGGAAVGATVSGSASDRPSASASVSTPAPVSSSPPPAAAPTTRPASEQPETPPKSVEIGTITEPDGRASPGPDSRAGALPGRGPGTRHASDHRPLVRRMSGQPIVLMRVLFGRRGPCDSARAADRVTPFPPAPRRGRSGLAFLRIRPRGRHPCLDGWFRSCLDGWFRSLRPVEDLHLLNTRHACAHKEQPRGPSPAGLLLLYGELSNQGRVTIPCRVHFPTICERVEPMIAISSLCSFWGTLNLFSVAVRSAASASNSALLISMPLWVTSIGRPS